MIQSNARYFRPIHIHTRIHTQACPSGSYGSFNRKQCLRHYALITIGWQLSRKLSRATRIVSIIVDLGVTFKGQLYHLAVIGIHEENRYSLKFQNKFYGKSKYVSTEVNHISCKFVLNQNNKDTNYFDFYTFFQITSKFFLNFMIILIYK